MDEVTSTLRRFNRSYTQRIGVLEESFLGTGRPLGQARLLYEIGLDGAGVQELRERLGLDSGYVSRMLRQLEADRAITVAADPADGRRRVARLTARGRREWSLLEQRSEALAEALVAELSVAQRARLADALHTADRLLRAATVTFDPVDAASDEALWSLGQYFAELDRRFPGGFDPGEPLVDGVASMRGADSCFVVAHSDGRPIACGGIQRHDATTHEIKRMWVHPDWRGLGVARRLLADLEHRVAALGSVNVVLDTNSVLVEAIAMYETAGYHAIPRYNDNPYAKHWFGKALRATRGTLQ